MSEEERMDRQPESDVEGQAFRAGSRPEEPVRRPRDDARGKGPRPALDVSEDDVLGHAGRPPMRPIEASP
jgi:hypothetical protein